MSWARACNATDDNCSGVSLSKIYNPHKCNCRGFTTRCKPLVAFKTRKARSDGARKHLKIASRVLQSDSLVRWNQEIRMMEEKDMRGSAGPRHVSGMVEVVLWHGRVWMPVECSHWCLLIDDVTADWSRKMKSEVYVTKLSAHIQTHAKVTVQMDDNP